MSDARKRQFSKAPRAWLVESGDFLDRNENNFTSDDPNSSHSTMPVCVLVKLITFAIRYLDNKRGSTLKEIQKVLVYSNTISAQTDLRPAMILALKIGEIARPDDAVKAGIYGRYVLGDGIPIFLGKTKSGRKTTKCTKQRGTKKYNRKKTGRSKSRS